MIDVNSYLLAQIAASPPELVEQWGEFEELYNKKLWHQLTLKLLTFVKEDSLQKGTLLLDLYTNFLADFENKINPLSLVEILCYVIKQITDFDSCVEFVAKTKEKVKSCVEAVILCNIISGRRYLDKKDLPKFKTILEETQELIDSIDGVSSVHGRYYQLSSDYYQIIGHHAHYYRDALRFLGCIKLSEISLEDQKTRAFTLSLAALLGEGVYNFGELLSHPILDCLKGTSKQWVVDLLHAFNSGCLVKYESLRPAWISQADLAANELALRQKISLLCLMEMTLRCDRHNRTFSFTEIATKAQLPESEVELLVMKALSLGLVKGSIDEVDKTVTLVWMQPRVLSIDQISSLKTRLDIWCEDVKSMELLLENKGQDILT